MDCFSQYTRDSFRTTPAEAKIAFSHTDENPLRDSAEQSRAGQTRFLRSLGVDKSHIAAFEQRALENGSTVDEELLMSGLVTADVYFSAFAEYLRLPFLPEIASERVANLDNLDLQLTEPRLLRLIPQDGKMGLLIVPELARLDLLTNILDELPHLFDELAVTTPQAMRDAIWKAGEARRLAETRQRLFNAAPQHSAKITLHGQQGFYGGVLATLLVLSLLTYSEIALAWLHTTLSMLYLNTLLFRLFALIHIPRETDVEAALSRRHENELPVYTILVALYREEAVIEQLVNALERLDWPRSRLDIKLVCEADDGATIEAIRRINPGPHMEIVQVPPSEPRTKPKALTYALSGARGTFVVVYDAEDRPHPQQLREAYAAFRNQPEDMACVQAPLIISNASSSWLSACFALEYAGLFSCMLPALATHGLPLPLGGTSNHFRTAALRRAGAWDPYNVTEDADLGLRLHRLGYRCGVIRRQTLEDAPTSLPVWLNQRTRWFKGWLQSWLVMTRTPFATARTMGWFAYMTFQLLIGGMLLSSLTHPLLFVSLVFMAIAIRENGVDLLFRWQGALFFIDALNIVGSYTIFVLMGRSRMIAYERRQVGRRWLAMPLYWLMLSVAAWRAVVELKTRPFVWNKTPHVPVAKDKT
ncbi:glycosyltransferase [Agrobacterium sp. ATCC 31749]|uniref:glycosyltransferase family 2 protein n=1 Tax=unclassified Agrobacterium TaxID=2632611 RepID=UPI00020DB3DF|nr:MULTISPECIES: glycosyltransferase family 2 protein [unclassified Agrobacterium]EGL64330.1 glycosyltransferase [Agrobacterium sp. ATCC 31749]